MDTSAPAPYDDADKDMISHGYQSYQWFQWYIISQYYINKFICIGLDWVRCLHTADDLFYQQNVKKKMELSSPADRWFLMTGDVRM